MNSTTTAATATALDPRAIEAFLYREARLADENRYDEWLALWTDDARYWIPSNSYDYDPEQRISIVYDDRSRLQDRIDRLKSGAAWAQEPRSRMRRIISNIEIQPVSSQGETTVISNAVIGELRRSLQTAYFAQQIHRLRMTADGPRMTYKKVNLINNDEPIHNLSFIL